MRIRTGIISGSTPSPFLTDGERAGSILPRGRLLSGFDGRNLGRPQNRAEPSVVAVKGLTPAEEIPASPAVHAHSSRRTSHNPVSLEAAYGVSGLHLVREYDNN